MPLEIVRDSSGKAIGTREIPANAPINPSSSGQRFESNQARLEAERRYSEQMAQANAPQYTYEGTAQQQQIIYDKAGHPIGTAPIYNIRNVRTYEITSQPATDLTSESQQSIAAYERQVGAARTEAALQAKALQMQPSGKMTGADVAYNIQLGYQAAELEAGRVPPGVTPAQAIALGPLAASGKLSTPIEMQRADELQLKMERQYAASDKNLLGWQTFLHTGDIGTPLNLGLASLAGNQYEIKRLTAAEKREQIKYLYDVESMRAGGISETQIATNLKYSSPVLRTASGVIVAGGLMGAAAGTYPKIASTIGDLGTLYIGGTMIKGGMEIRKGQFEQASNTLAAPLIYMPLGVIGFKAGYQAATGVELDLGIHSPLRYEKVTWKGQKGKDIVIERDVFWRTTQRSEPFRLLGKENVGSVFKGWKGPMNQNWQLSEGTLGKIGFGKTDFYNLHGIAETKIAEANAAKLFTTPKAASRFQMTMQFNRMMYNQPSSFQQKFPNLSRLKNAEGGKEAFLKWAKENPGMAYGSSSQKTQMPEKQEWYFKDVDYQTLKFGKAYDKSMQKLLSYQAEKGNILTSVKVVNPKTQGVSTEFYNPAGEKVFDIKALQNPEEYSGLGFWYGQKPIKMFGSKGVWQMPLSEASIRADTMANTLPSGMPKGDEMKVIWRGDVMKNVLSQSAGGKGASLISGIRSTYSKATISASYAAAGGKVAIPVSFMPSVPSSMALLPSSMASLPSFSASSFSYSMSLSSRSSSPSSKSSSPSSSASYSPSFSISPSSSLPSSPSPSPSRSPSYSPSPSKSPSSSPSSSPSYSISPSTSISPPFPVPAVPINMGGGGFKLPSLFRTTKRSYAYSPSITALIFKIRGPKPKQKIFTGAEIRPIPFGFAKRRRKR